MKNKPKGKLFYDGECFDNVVRVVESNDSCALIEPVETQTTTRMSIAATLTAQHLKKPVVLDINQSHWIVLPTDHPFEFAERWFRYSAPMRPAKKTRKFRNVSRSSLVVTEVED